MPALAFSLNLSHWDFLMVAVVTTMAGLSAYLSLPARKTFVLLLPVPFTVAFLSLGKPVDATHALGLVNLLIFSQAVRVLHLRLRLPVVAAIAVSTLAYVAMGWLIARYAPRGETLFWIVAGSVFAVSLTAWKLSSPPSDPPHRTPLPIWIKIPAIAAIVLSIMLLKHQLSGTVTTFPFVGTLTAYESRKCLGTYSRQFLRVVALLTSMIATIGLLQHWMPPATALGVAWIFYAAILLMLPEIRPHILRSLRGKLGGRETSTSRS